MGDNSIEAMQTGKTTRAEYQRSAENICRLLLRLPAFSFMQGKKTELDLELEQCGGAEAEELTEMRLVKTQGDTVTITPDMINTAEGEDESLSDRTG